MSTEIPISIFGGHHLKVLPPLSLYIHFPWCIKKCPYCDFNSHESTKNSISENDYINTVLLDLEQELPYIWGRSINTIFIGGGTPSLMSIKGMNKLLNGIRSLINLIPNAEITLEANPGTFENNKFKGYFDAGINRISLGIQSLQDKHLKNLGRIHNSKEAINALEKAVLIFPKVNADIMYGLPSQNSQEACNDIKKIIETGITHISAYQLTLEPNTFFYHQPPKNLPDEDHLIDIEKAVQELLSKNKFERYEISAYTKNKQYCQHNLNYWLFGDYIGIGAGAHGKISQHNCIERTTKAKNPKNYLEQIHQIQKQNKKRFSIKNKDLTFEFMLNSLRLVNGFEKKIYEERTGLPFFKINHIIEKAYKQNLIIIEKNNIKPTVNGLLYLNNLLDLFLI